MLKWTRESSAAAIAEGWDIFENDEYGRHIERHDEAEIFASDDEAIAFVRAEAEAGSLLHQRAVEIHDSNPTR